MYIDRRRIAEERAMAVAVAYEVQRGARCVDVSRGNIEATDAMRRALLIPDREPVRLSADLVSVRRDEVRLIEVKGRGSSGPVSVLERQIKSFTTAGDRAWLYVVWNTTQAPPYDLWTIQNPARLPWTCDRPATRPPGTFRGARHEATFTIDPDTVHARGHRACLDDVPGLPPKDR